MPVLEQFFSLSGEKTTLLNNAETRDLVDTLKDSRSMFIRRPLVREILRRSDDISFRAFHCIFSVHNDPEVIFLISEYIKEFAPEYEVSQRLGAGIMKGVDGFLYEQTGIKTRRLLILPHSFMDFTGSQSRGLIDPARRTWAKFIYDHPRIFLRLSNYSQKELQRMTIYSSGSPMLRIIIGEYSGSLDDIFSW